MPRIPTFSEVRPLDVTWLPDLRRPGSEIFTTCVEKMHEQVCQKWRAAVSKISAKKSQEGGGEGGDV